jgi:uncharacterized membrane protein
MRAVLPTMLAALGASAGSLGAQTFTVGPNDGAVAYASTAQVPSPTNQQTVTITNTGATVLGAATLGATSYSAGGTGWLSVSKLYTGSSLAVGATTDLLRVSVTPGALAAGTYTATVPVTVAGATSGTSVVVTLSVAGPTFGPSPNTVASWSATTTSANPTARVYLKNVGSTRLEGVARGTIEYPTGTPAWLTQVTLQGGTSITPGNEVYLLMSPSDTLRAGTYTARIPATSTNATNSPYYTDVTFTTAGPSLAVDGAVNGAAAATLTTGPGAIHPSTSLTVRNVGTSAARNPRVGTITYGPGRTGWLSASIGSQDLGVNIARTLTLSATSAATFAPGTYTASFPILANNVDAAQAPTVTVTLVVGRPQMAVSPEALTFTSDAATPLPAGQFVQVDNAGGSTLSWGVTKTEYAEAQTGWVSTTIFSNSASISPGSPGTLQVRVSPSALPEGTYHATLTISALNDATVPAKQVAVTLTRSGTSISMASTAAITARNGGGKDTARVDIVNGGSGTLSGLSLGAISYAEGQPTGWLTAALEATTAPTKIRAITTSEGLPAGTYTATVPVIAPNASNSPRTLTVNYTVTAPKIVVASQNEYFVRVVGGADGAAQTRAITNGGTIPVSDLAVSVSYAAGSGSGWLEATLDRTTAPATITMQPRIAGLTPRNYVGYVTVTSTAAGVQSSPSTFEVRLEVQDAPTIAFRYTNSTSSATSHSFTATAGAANPAPVTLNVVNGSGGTLNQLALGQVEYGPGASGWLGTALSGTTVNSVLTLTPSVAGLQAGTYTANVFVTSPVATNSPKAFPVTLNVAAAPEIALSATTHATTEMQGGTASSKTITVSNVTGGPLDGLTIGAIEYGANGAGWLVPTLSKTATPATLTLAFASAQLAPGTYTAIVPVTAPTAINGPKTVAVTLTITRRPAIALSTTSVAMAAQANGNTTAPFTVDVTNGGDNTLSGLSLGAIQYGAGASNWLTASISSSGAPAQITLRASPAGLAAGTYTAQLPVVSSSSSVQNSPQTVTVTFTVSAQPILAFSETNPALGAQAGSAAVTRTLTVQNAGGGTLDGLAVQAINYASASTGWLQATLDGTTAPATLTLTATPGALAAGTYTANVVVASPAASNGTQVLPVTFTVTARPAIALGASTASFAAVQGGATPAAKTVAITNGGAGTLDGLTATVSDVNGQGATWLGAQLDRTTAPATLTIVPNTAGLAVGTHTATITVASAQPDVAPKTVTVTVVVSAAPAQVAFARPSVLLSIQVNALAARMQTVGVTNAGGGSLTGLAVSGTAYDGARTNWMLAALSGTTAPATLTLRTQARALPMGYYTATLTLTGANAVAGTLPVGIEVIDVKVAEAALSDASKLPAEERTRLDQLGNADGTYNLGDYLALRARLGLN